MAFYLNFLWRFPMKGAANTGRILVCSRGIDSWEKKAGVRRCAIPVSSLHPRLGHTVEVLSGGRRCQVPIYLLLVETLLTVASLQTVHFTTCWWSLLSRLISDWHTRQFITGMPTASGLAMAVYGGGSSAKKITVTRVEFKHRKLPKRSPFLLVTCIKLVNLPWFQSRNTWDR